MWQERKILVDGYNHETESVCELVEVIIHRFYVNRIPVRYGRPDYSKEVQDEEKGSLFWSQLMAEKLELF